MEAIYIEITAKDGRKIIVGSLYRPPNVSTLPFQNHIIKTMNIVRKEKGQKNVILGMDHNNDLLKAHLHTITQEFLSSMMDSGLLPTITRPTRITKNSATLIDNIFVTEELHKNFDSLLIVDDMSDHFPVLALLKQKRLRDKDPLEFESRNLTDKKILEIKQQLQNTDWNGVLNSDSCDENFNRFHTAVQESMNKVAPIRKVKISGKRRFCEPWLTKGIEKSSHKKNKLYKETLKRGASAITIKNYKNYRNAYNKLKRQAKIQYYRTRAEEYKSNTKKLWQLINSTISKSKYSGNIISSITVDGLQQSTPKAVANCFGEFYSNLGSSLANQVPPSKVNIETYIKRIQRNENSMFLNYTSKEEIESIVKSLPNKISSGYDQISNNLLKQLSSSISYPLEIIFNQSIQQGIFPTLMKKVEVIPLYKGKDREEVINYRPISLLITISKLLEKIVYKRVYKFLDNNSILYDSQYGFRSKRSCSQAIAELTGKILQAREDGKKSASIFLDLSKAFDTLDHSVLLKKLDSYGIRGVVNNWFSSYLSGRKLTAKVMTRPGCITYSDVYDIHYGTAQGSCLGPLLFIIFCNDIQQLPLIGSLILFADDTTLSHSHKNINYLEFALKHDMGLLLDWFRANKLTLNLNKTLMMQYWPGKGRRVKLIIENDEIPMVEHTRFLGVHIDNKLEWSVHTRLLVQKLKANQYLLSRSKNILPTNCLRNIYYSHIHSHLQYGLLVWGGSVCKKELTGLIKIQNQCLKLISPQIDSKDLYKNLQILQLTDMIQLELIKFGYKIAKHEQPLPLQELMNARGGKKIHRYPTRGKSVPNIQKHTSEIFNKSFIRKSMSEFSKLPDSIKNSKSIGNIVKKFKSRLN